MQICWIVGFGLLTAAFVLTLFTSPARKSHIQHAGEGQQTGEDDGPAADDSGETGRR